MISVPRLLAAPGPALSDHLGHFGELPHPTAELIATVEQSGLTGRGGAGFPTGRKMASVTGAKPVVVGNGAEGEPLSRKDATLLTRAPHLVLDGLDAAAAAIGADKVYLYVHPDATPSVAEALGERRAAGLDAHRVTVVTAPDRFVAGEESAALRHIEGGPALPRDRTVVSSVSGVRGRPTLVNNVETLAHLALIARYGADWFRSVGDAHEPGTMLVTLSGSLEQGIVEIPTGAPLDDLLRSAGADPGTLRAVLIGGYHGTWLGPDEFGVARLSRSALTPLGASPGAGIVHALERTECGLSRTAEIAGYLADQSARQCGPCLNGLPRLASLLDELAFGRASDDLVQEIRRMVRMVDGRGSCRHPDGTARMVRSALHTFADEVDLHCRRRCSAGLSGGAEPHSCGDSPSS
jgi:NADH:ubiquinone oxidoreductase subunit F (NADH-binding)